MPPCGPFDDFLYEILNIESRIVATGYDIKPEWHWHSSVTELGDGEKAVVERMLIEVYVSDLKKLEFTNVARNRINIAFISNAFACSPQAPYTKEKISSILVTSDSDYSAEITAGRSLNSVIQIVYNEGSEIDGKKLVSDLDQFIKNTPTAGHVLQLRLLVPPTLNSLHSLRIVLKLDSGKYFEIYTKPVTFAIV